MRSVVRLTLALWLAFAAPAFARTAVPKPLERDTILLEGRALKVLGPMQGHHLHATALWAPPIGALFDDDLVFNRMYLWFGGHDGAAWPGLLAASGDSAELREKVAAAFPGSIDVPGDFLLGNENRVAKGEQEAWKE